MNNKLLLSSTFCCSLLIHGYLWLWGAKQPAKQQQLISAPSLTRLSLALQQAEPPPEPLTPSAIPEPSAQTAEPEIEPEPEPPTEPLQVAKQLEQPATKQEQMIITEPVFLEQPIQPKYPAVAKRRRQQGTVWIEVHVSAQGESTDWLILESSGVHALDQAALTAVKQWAFMPAKQGSQSVAALIHVPVRFVLS